MQLVAKGLRYTTIASRLYLSNGTVRNYASTAYTKLGVRNKEEAVQKALEIELLNKKRFLFLYSKVKCSYKVQ
ncbi:response regulator transcription factor [Bacillus cereus]